MYGLKMFSHGEIVFESWHSTMFGILGILNDHESVCREMGINIDRVIISYEEAV